MKLNNTLTLEQTLDEHNGAVAAIRCSKCDGLSTFDMSDIEYRRAVIADARQRVAARGYVSCPWCGNEMIVSELNDAGMMVGKYFTMLEGDVVKENTAGE